MERSIDDLYIKELFSQLSLTEIDKKEKGLIPSYSEGIRLLVDVFTKHKKEMTQVFFIGNGGSAAIASHMTADFMKNGGMNTYIFSRPIEFLAKEHDLLVAISSSGNSRNILYAIEAAKKKNAAVITFTGFKPDNKARQLGDINVYVPCEKYGIVESIHNLILQQVVDMVMERDGVKL